MSYYSQTQYKAKEDTWFESLYFDRWFKETDGPVLDIGCATGNFIATHPERVEGVEFDEDCLAVCRERGFNVRKIDITSEFEQVPAERYGGVYAKQVIEHVPNPLYFMRNIHRALAPGGTGVILTPNCPYALSRFFWDDYTHVRPLTRTSLTRLALDAGFTDFRVYTDFRCFRGLGYLMRTFGITPEQVSKAQRLLGIPGLSLILEVRK